MIKIIIATFAVLLSISDAQHLRSRYYGRQQYAGPVGYAVQPQPQYIAQPQYGVLRPQYASHPRYAEDESYKPFSFGYNNVDEYGTQLGRQEVADGSGNVRGSYSYRDANGQFRQVEYESDPVGGFRAVINTNEHGVVSHKPADAVYIKH